MITTVWTFCSLLFAGMTAFAIKQGGTGVLDDDKGERVSSLQLVMMIALAPFIFVILAVKSFGDNK